MDKILQPLLDLPPFTVYLLIGLLCWSEGAFFLGFVTPGELAVVTGGILASRDHVQMDILLGVVVFATVAGNTTGFYVGRRWGAGMLEWAPLQRFFGTSIQRTQDFMIRRGEWAIVLSRVSTPTRIVVPFLAGASKVRYRRFVLLDVPASLVWALVYATLGFVLGASWDVIREVSGNAALLVLILFLLAVLIRWVAARVAANRRRVEALFRLTLRVTGTQGIARTLAPGFRWLSRRFDPGVARGLSLTLGFVALLGAIGAVGLVFSHTQAVQGLALIDFPVLEWMGETRTDAAVSIARSGLLAFDWPGVVAVALPLMVLALWRVGWLAAIRIGVGVVSAAAGAYFLDRFVLDGHVPGAEFPSVQVAVAAALLVHSTALFGRILDWGGAVACAAIGTFGLCTVALGTLVAGWAAPSGIALGLALGMAWATTLELPGAALRPESASPEDGQGTEQRRTDQ
ncbi:MAG: DedA family protein [Wenzhouxiangellaceae bacterium]